jgi:hypothetical protein
LLRDGRADGGPFFGTRRHAIGISAGRVASVLLLDHLQESSALIDIRKKFPSIGLERCETNRDLREMSFIRLL